MWDLLYVVKIPNFITGNDQYYLVHLLLCVFFKRDWVEVCDISKQLCISHESVNI